MSDAEAAGAGERRAGPRGISPNALVLVAIWLASAAGLQWIPSQAQILIFVFVVSGWLLSVILHEWGHAYIAHRAGDWTVAERGYLTGDPFKYTSLLTSIILPLAILALGGIGFPGAAVYLREDLMRSRAWRSAASLAGPAGTLVAFVLLTIATHAAMAGGGVSLMLVAGLACLVFLQATALILNLLPIPGLDGYGVIRPFLPRGLRRTISRYEGAGILLLFGLILIVPGIGRALFLGAGSMLQAVGVSPTLAMMGLSELRFWR